MVHTLLPQPCNSSDLTLRRFGGLEWILCFVYYLRNASGNVLRTDFAEVVVAVTCSKHFLRGSAAQATILAEPCHRVRDKLVVYTSAMLAYAESTNPNQSEHCEPLKR
jgi:hypothetical protein